MEIRTAKIYTLTCPIDGSVKYIGSTKTSLERRLYQHIKSGKVGSHLNNMKSEWIKSVLAMGLIPTIEEIETVNELDRYETEKYWIGQFNVWGISLFNVVLNDKNKLLLKQIMIAGKPERKTRYEMIKMLKTIRKTTEWN